ncbi:hypothetical protein B0H19DRAFT_1067784 [Mycena capillaripes]|nr:hypothetical protein B0H19DRAFT_1067784 [Mycena capillaripes]
MKGVLASIAPVIGVHLLLLANKHGLKQPTGGSLYALGPMSNTPAPVLPEDLEREIFEIAARARLQSIQRFILVAWRVWQVLYILRLPPHFNMNCGSWLPAM